MSQLGLAKPKRLGGGGGGGGGRKGATAPLAAPL